MIDRKTLENELTKELIDQGKIIEAGFALFRKYIIADGAPPLQVDEMRMAFMAGAEHVFSSLMNVLDPGDEPSARDLKRMDLIAAEIERWRAVVSERAKQGKATKASTPPPQTLGDAPIEERFRDKMNYLAGALDGFFNDPAKSGERKTGFVLLIFPFGDAPGRTNFISNGADRKDIVVLFKEMIARFEGQPEIRGRA